MAPPTHLMHKIGEVLCPTYKKPRQNVQACEITKTLMVYLFYGNGINKLKSIFPFEHYYLRSHFKVYFAVQKLALTSENTSYKRIDRVLIITACLPCFGLLVMLPATTQLWHHNQIKQVNFIVLLLHNFKFKLWSSESSTKFEKMVEEKINVVNISYFHRVIFQTDFYFHFMAVRLSGNCCFSWRLQSIRFALFGAQNEYV